MVVSDKEAQQREKIFDFVEKDMLSTKVMLPNSWVFKLDGCIPSGKYSTQLVGSIINMIAIRTLLYMQECRIEEMHVLGDDSLTFVPTGDMERFFS